MIAALAGNLLTKTPDRAVIDVNGVGYEVLLSTDGVARLPEAGEAVLLHIHTHVREDAIALYGFWEQEEKELFLTLKTVSGIGPKLALAMISGMRVTEICQAISGGDVKRLTTLPGVGKKTAERICVDLKDKVSHLLFLPAGSGPSKNRAAAPGPGSAAADALSALTNLGYSESVAQGALMKVKESLGDEGFSKVKLEALIRETLKVLA
jgi:Holliday junction DNA helicase RuvA